MKKLSPIAYRALFFKHVWRFLGNLASPDELKGRHAIAVSGGLDSMALLWVACTLHKQEKIGPVRALFVHHHTRKGQDKDRAMIEKFCRQEGVPFVELHAENLRSGEGNFEARARKIRRNLCLSELHGDELLWAGQHLDDSYEWFLMQRSRSTNPKSSLGIPVRNRNIIRPFLCVSRRQIARLAEFEAIPFREDPTNKDLRFDRNYIRHRVVPLLRKRFPKYLKHYAQTMNFAALHMRVSAISRAGSARLYVFELGAVMVGKVFSEVEILEVLHTYSNTDRGELITPIQRMLRAIENGKKGPFYFSGGMKAYHAHNVLMLYQQSFSNNDDSVAKALTHLSLEQLNQMPTYKWIELQHAWANLVQAPDALCNMPGLVLVLEPRNVQKTLNTSVYDPMFPMVSEVCREKGYRFSTFQKLIETWSTKKEKLPERLKLIPLYNLSNLFPTIE